MSRLVSKGLLLKECPGSSQLRPRAKRSPELGRLDNRPRRFSPDGSFYTFSGHCGACQRKAYQDHGRPAASNSACKRKEQEAAKPPEQKGPKKPRLVFTDLQRRTLHAIFKENKRPSKEMQAQIAKQLGLDLSTVCNFFMNARRRSQDKWQEDEGKSAGSSSNGSTPTSCTK
ncbi:ONECUT1 [Branchiostoma lanceolatum]|uniref:ONECUT1 protein n=1 Tax=Branchiostoma lanceolatum TaxID=7740 RepID=A0A8J9ZD22_BRALA|nr:ONECUT1 [Branchiostoma lanceolatum]